MQTHTQKVAALGEVLWDMLPEGRRLGGAPANFACHVAQFGLDACLVSAVGDDEPGHAALNELGRRGLDRYIAVVPNRPTGTVGVQLDAAGIPAYEIHRDVAWDFIPWTDALAELAAGVQAVCFGTLALRSPVSRQTLTRFLDAMPRGGGRLRMLDVNLRPPLPSDDTVIDALARCNVLKLNDEELPRVAVAVGLPPDLPPEETARRLRADCGLQALILTCGARGSHVFTPDAESHLATPHVDVADTVGAGDSFTAAFTAALLRGADVAKAHRLAVRTSAYVCTQHGATPALPADITQAIR